MKADPEDLKGLAAEIDNWMRSKPEVVKAEPQITGHLVKARDEAQRRYAQVGEKHGQKQRTH